MCTGIAVREGHFVFRHFLPVGFYIWFVCLAQFHAWLEDNGRVGCCCWACGGTGEALVRLVGAPSPRPMAVLTLSAVSLMLSVTVMADNVGLVVGGWSGVSGGLSLKRYWSGSVNYTRNRFRSRSARTLPHGYTRSSVLPGASSRELPRNITTKRNADAQVKWLNAIESNWTEVSFLAECPIFTAEMPSFEPPTR